MQAEDRPLVVAKNGAVITKVLLKSAWTRGIKIAIWAKLTTEDERFVAVVRCTVVR